MNTVTDIPSTWSEQTLELDGRSVRVARRGHGDQLPLLLITGIGAHIEMWNPFVHLLGDRPLIAFDAPGTGESDALACPVRMRGMARVVERILDRLGVDKKRVGDQLRFVACAELGDCRVIELARPAFADLLRP